MVHVKARVFRGDDSVLQLGRNLAEGNELIVRLIRLVVNPGLEAALEVDGGGWRIDPAEGHEGERGEGPEQANGDERPFQNRPKNSPAGSVKTLCWRDDWGCVGRFSHISG
jgi:hypothetical protein